MGRIMHSCRRCGAFLAWFISKAIQTRECVTINLIEDGTSHNDSQQVPVAGLRVWLREVPGAGIDFSRNNR
jgi:hypothetical protein